MLVSGSGEIKIWNPNYNYYLVKTLTGHTREVTSLLRLSNGMLCSGSREIKIWNHNNNNYVKKVGILRTNKRKDINIIKDIN